MSTKKIIIILIIILLVLIGIMIIITKSSPSPGKEASESMPTGVVKPTDEIQNNELDIVSLIPKDGSTDVSRSQPITISFSRSFSINEIEYHISPNTPHQTTISGSVLRITPDTTWDEGTIYTHSIVFPDDLDKVRLYRFSTKGESQKFLPDTRPVDLVQQVEQEEKENETDIYVANHTPYENEIFGIQADFEPKTPAHFFFTIIPKTDDSQLVQQEVDAWLQSLDLRDEQINSLDIRYQ